MKEYLINSTSVLVFRCPIGVHDSILAEKRQRLEAIRLHTILVIDVVSTRRRSR
jgi:hypothetical protein